MAKYGLVQVDLNKRAQLAILGFSASPATDIEKLFSSDQPIEEDTRALLSDLFAGRTTRLTMKLDVAISPFRLIQLRDRLLSIYLAGLAIERMDQLGYEGAIQAVSDETGIGFESLRKAVGRRRAALKWSRGRKLKDGDPPDLTDGHFYLAFEHSKMRQTDPEDEVKTSLPALYNALKFLHENMIDGYLADEPGKAKVPFP